MLRHTTKKTGPLIMHSKKIEHRMRERKRILIFASYFVELTNQTESNIRINLHCLIS